MTELETKQIFFLECIARFIFDAKNLGYTLTCGEFWRSPETCALYAKEGKGIANSNHQNRLAADLNAFKGYTLIPFTVFDYFPLGNLWESYSTAEHKCCWGGRFIKMDVDHFSVEFNGIE